MSKFLCCGRPRGKHPDKNEQAEGNKRQCGKCRKRNQLRKKANKQGKNKRYYTQ